jgi:hypothetical protein
MTYTSVSLALYRVFSEDVATIKAEAEKRYFRTVYEELMPRIHERADDTYRLVSIFTTMMTAMKAIKDTHGQSGRDSDYIDVVESSFVPVLEKLTATIAKIKAIEYAET